MFALHVCNSDTHIDTVSNCSAQNFVYSVQLTPQLGELLLTYSAMTFGFRLGGSCAQSVVGALIRILAHELLPPDVSTPVVMIIGMHRQLLRQTLPIYVLHAVIDARS